MKKITYYWNLFATDRSAFRYQLWMVWNRRKIQSIQWVYTVYAKLTQTFITTHSRPLKSSDIHTWDDLTNSDSPSIAIILQGPIVAKQHFTRETVLLYKKHFPKHTIIVSTWDDENPALLHSLRNAGAEVVLSAKPAISGIGNVNLQIVSTLAGIHHARTLGAEFVYKTRCDERMYNPNASQFLVQLLRVFPVASGYAQKYRIIGSSFGTLKYVPYLFTDVFQFGHIDDMLSFWSAAHDPRTTPSKMVHTIADLSAENMCEQYLTSTYLTRIGHTLPWTIQDWWSILAHHFIIADQATLDIFFYKYDFYAEHRGRHYDGVSANAHVTFSDWLVFYSQKDALPTAPEHWQNYGRHALAQSKDASLTS